MEEKKKFYQKKWFLWLWLVIFPPVGLALLWTVHRSVEKRAKIILSAVFTCWFFIALAVDDSDHSNAEDGQTGVVAQAGAADVEQEETGVDAADVKQAETGAQTEDIKQTSAKKPDTTDKGKLPEKAAKKRSTKKKRKDEFVNHVKKAVNDLILKDEGQKILGVRLKNRDLCVFADISEYDPGPNTKKDVATSLVSFFTDQILDFSRYDDLWDTVSIDFVDLGRVTNGKDNIKDDGYGRYFDDANFKFLHDGEQETENEERREQKNHPDTIDKNGSVNYITQVLNKEIGGYKASSSLSQWTAAWFDEKGAIILSTDIIWKGNGSKASLIGVFTPSYKAQTAKIQGGTLHYLSIGNIEYYNDHYCDEVFETISQALQQLY